MLNMLATVEEWPARVSNIHSVCTHEPLYPLELQPYRSEIDYFKRN